MEFQVKLQHPIAPKHVHVLIIILGNSYGERNKHEVVII